jgi:hypothetical protein
MRACLAVLVVLPLSSCAWTARANRPLWNVFEPNLVPGSDGAFYATLPLTVPAGIGAIVLDTFVAHPLQVVDDAFGDAADLWTGIDLADGYYTESALLPLRAVATPLWFLGSFLGRSMFDWPSDEDQAARRADAEQRRRAAELAFCRAIAAGGQIPLLRRLEGPFDDELRAALAAALASGSAAGRMAVCAVVARCAEPGVVDWQQALGDPSAVVRHHVLGLLPAGLDVGAAVRQRLLEDPDQAVRERAAQRWPR